MAVLGLILLAAAGVLTAAVVTSNTDSLSVDLWNISVSNVTLGVVFVAGMITTVLAVVGLGMLTGGLRRGRRLRQERRSLRRENEMLAQQVDSTDSLDSPSVRTGEPAPTGTAPRGETRVEPAPPYAEPASPSGMTRPTGPDSAAGEPGRRSWLPRRERHVDSDSTSNT